MHAGHADLEQDRVKRPAAPTTEVVRKVVRRVVRPLISCLIRKVISTCTSWRTTLLTRGVMSLDDESPWSCGEERATPPPADESEVMGEAAPDPSLPTT